MSINLQRACQLYAMGIDNDVPSEFAVDPHVSLITFMKRLSTSWSTSPRLSRCIDLQILNYSITLHILKTATMCIETTSTSEGCDAIRKRLHVCLGYQKAVEDHYASGDTSAHQSASTCVDYKIKKKPLPGGRCSCAINPKLKSCFFRAQTRYAYRHF